MEEGSLGEEEAARRLAWWPLKIRGFGRRWWRIHEISVDAFLAGPHDEGGRHLGHGRRPVRPVATTGRRRGRLEDLVDPEAGASELGEQRRERAGVAALAGVAGTERGRLERAAADAQRFGIAGVEQREHGVGERDHERALGAQHPVHLAEHAPEVLGAGERPHADGGVDGVGPEEGQLGERRLVQLDLDVGGVDGGAGGGRRCRRSGSTAIVRAPPRDTAMALRPAPQPRSSTRLPATSPRRRRSRSRGISGPYVTESSASAVPAGGDTVNGVQAMGTVSFLRPVPVGHGGPVVPAVPTVRSDDAPPSPPGRQSRGSGR